MRIRDFLDTTCCPIEQQVYKELRIVKSNWRDATKWKVHPAYRTFKEKAKRRPLRTSFA